MKTHMTGSERAPLLSQIPGLGRLIAALSLLLAAGCFGDSPTDIPPAPDITEVNFAPSLGINVSEFTAAASGLHYKDEIMGEGTPVTNGSNVSVHYWGWLPNGTLFDSSQGSGPLTFTVGAADLIAGFQEGVLGMRPGGSRLLLIPPHLGYGERGAGNGAIPPNAWLVFRMQLQVAGG